MGGYWTLQKDDGTILEDTYIFSFAKRTKENLIMLERFAALNLSEKESLCEKLNIKKIYESTQLINSIIGLLVFPKESFWDRLTWCTRFNTSIGNTEDERIANQILDHPGEHFYSTYKRYFSSRKTYDLTTDEGLSPNSLIRHLRNAVSHDHLKVYPYDQNTQIQGFFFYDELEVKGYERIDEFIVNNNGGDSYKMDFKIYLTTNQLHHLLFAICDLLLQAEMDFLKREYDIQMDINSVY